MTESKYSKYIVTKPPANRKVPSYRHEPVNNIPGGTMTHMAAINSEVIPGAFTVATEWFWPRPGISEKIGVEAHTHPFDEVLGFFGTNPDDPDDLGAEIEFWLGDEKHILTKSCLVYIPAGLKHCPLIHRRVDRPFFHFGGHK